MISKKQKSALISIGVSLIVISAYFIVYTPTVTIYMINDNAYPLNVTINVGNKVVMNSQVNGWAIGVSGHKSITTNLHVGGHQIQVSTTNTSYQKTDQINVYYDCYVLVHFRISGDVEISVTTEEPHFR